VDETVEYIAITRLQAAYADVVTRRAWAELPDLFLPEAPVHVDTVTAPVIELVGGRHLAEFVGRALERFEFFELVILNTVVEFDGPEAAHGRFYMVELRQEVSNGQWSNAFGVYQDRYARGGDGRWRFAERHYQSMARTGRGEVFAFPPAPPG
jgi:hypothetical protein